MERAREKIATLAPGRLGGLLSQGLRGHHPLFERDSILAAFALPDAPVAREDANEVGHALLAICRDPLRVARGTIAQLSDSARISLIRLYFRLLDRAEEERASLN
ncbi:MAG TPA: hypothetical protein VF875_14925 [Anaeromyxobacter sp.]